MYGIWLLCFALAVPWQIDAVSFAFKQKPLIDLIEYVAHAKQIDILLPSNTEQVTALKKELITTDIPEDLSIDEAWDMVQFFLNLSGFTLYQKKPSLYALATTQGSDIGTQTLETYVDTPINELPDNATRIRYYVTLRNLQLSYNPELVTGMDQLLKSLMSADAPAPIFDLQNHGFLLVDAANRIANILFLLRKLDAAAFTQSLEVLPLFNATAKDIEVLFQALKKAVNAEIQVPFIYERSLRNQGGYFIKDTTIVADNYTNSVILLGRESSLIQLREFIQNNLDIVEESGESVLHIYEAQYLDAKDLANIVNQVAKGSSGQATSTGQSYLIAPEQFFSDIVVAAEEYVTLEKKSTTQQIVFEKDKEVEIRGIENTPSIGGNRLVIAATRDKWPLLKEFMMKLDKPEPQVILDLFVVDFANDVKKDLAATTSNFTDSPIFQQGRQFLASHITPLVNVLGQTPTQLDQDLLGVIGANSFASAVPNNSLILSFNDPQRPGIMGLLQALQNYTNLRILSHPYLVATNHQKAYIESTQYLRTRGDLVIGNNGSYTITIEDVTATLKITVTPHIMTEDRVRLDVEIIIEDFVGNTLTRLTRNLNTTAAIKNKEILAMGGLLRDDYDASITYTPLIARIPIIGNFFQQTEKEHIRTNITLFLSPTIVYPRSQTLQNYTREKVEIGATDFLNDSGIINMRDPIQRMFFQRTTDEMLTAYTGYSVQPRMMNAEKKERAPASKNRNAASEIKALLALEDNPLLRVKKAHV